jgi:hypothetical protein
MRTRHGNEASDPDTRGDDDAGFSSELASIYSSAVRKQAAGHMVDAKVACERLIAMTEEPSPHLAPQPVVNATREKSLSLRKYQSFAEELSELNMRRMS